MALTGKAYSERLMRDTLKVETNSASQWGSSHANRTAALSDAIQCAVDFDTGAGMAEPAIDGSAGGAGAPVQAVRIAVPSSTTIVAGQRIQVTHRQRQELSSLEKYRVIGEPVIKLNLKVLVCERITTEAAR
jgi:hypothetical protein